MRGGHNKKLHSCFGWEITIYEAAQFCTVSAASIRGALSKLGGSMEAVLQFYDKRYGGVIARMENYMEAREPQEPTAEEAAVNDIMAALGMAEPAAEATEPETEAPEHEFVPERAEKTAVLLVPEDAQEEYMPPYARPVESREEQAPAPPEPAILFVEPDPPAAKDDTDAQRADLRRLNAAIEALEGLEKVELVQEYAAVQVEDMLLKLKEIRLNGFEDLIDWAAIAGKLDKE